MVLIFFETKCIWHYYVCNATLKTNYSRIYVDIVCYCGIIHIYKIREGGFS